jgi:hypothetical protein
LDDAEKLRQLNLNLDLAPDFLQLKGVSLSVFINSLQRLLFKPGLTLLSRTSHWGEAPDEPPSYLKTRRDVVHSFVGIMSLPFFCPKVLTRTTFRLPLSEFPYKRFVESLCHVSASYLETRESGENLLLADLLRNSFTLVAFLFPLPGVRSAIAELDATLLVEAFAMPGAPPLFDGSCLFLGESISFFYVTVTSHVDFLGALNDSGVSNGVVLGLIQVAKTAFERIGFSYLHSIIVSIILLLVTDSGIAARLSEPTDGDGSHADFLMNALLDLCEGEESFWPSVACIFDLLAPNVTSFSAATALRVIAFFETICKRQRVLAALFVDAFVAILQTTETVDNKFLAAFVKKAEVFDAIEMKAAKALRDFLEIAEEIMEEEEDRELDDEELISILNDLEFEESEMPKLMKNLHTFAGEMEKTWTEWTDLLFIRSCRAEVDQMQQFQKDCFPKLVRTLESLPK